MASLPRQIEQTFFRTLNSVVEPAVRHGVFSSRLLPTSLMVLESTGYLSGKPRSTPLFCSRLGPYLLLSTARGRRSFWVRNLQHAPEAHYYLGGRRYAAHAEVISASQQPDPQTLPPLMRPLLRPLQLLAKRGWAFALLRRR